MLVNELGTMPDAPLPPPPEPVDAPGPAKGDIPGVSNENLAKPDVGWEEVGETADGDAPEPKDKTDTQPLQDSDRSDSLGELRDGDAAKYEAQTGLPEDGDLRRMRISLRRPRERRSTPRRLSLNRSPRSSRRSSPDLGPIPNSRQSPKLSPRSRQHRTGRQ